MRLLEITTEIQSPVLREAHALQRERLQEDYDHEQVDFVGKKSIDRARALDMARRPDAILLRGVSGFYEAHTAFPGTPLVIDHCTDDQLSEAARGQHAFSRARFLCYSEAGAANLRRAGGRRMTMLRGPWLTDLRESRPVEKTLRVGFVPGPWARQALLDTLREAREKRWNHLEFFSLDRLIGVSQVDSPEELASVSDVLVYSLETEDRGAPNDGAILAATYGCGLISVQTDSLDASGLQKDVHYALAPKYTRGGYARGIESYLMLRSSLDAGISALRYDAGEFHTSLGSALS